MGMGPHISLSAEALADLIRAEGLGNAEGGIDNAEYLGKRIAQMGNEAVRTAVHEVEHRRRFNPDPIGEPLIDLMRFSGELRRDAGELEINPAHDKCGEAFWQRVLHLHLMRLFKCAAEMMNCGAMGSAKAILTSIEMLLWIAGLEDLRDELAQQIEEHEHRLYHGFRDIAEMTPDEREAVHKFGRALMHRNSVTAEQREKIKQAALKQPDVRWF